MYLGTVHQIWYFKVVQSPLLPPHSCWCRGSSVLVFTLSWTACLIITALISIHGFSLHVLPIFSRFLNEESVQADAKIMLCFYMSLVDTQTQQCDCTQHWKAVKHRHSLHHARHKQDVPIVSYSHLSIYIHHLSIFAIYLLITIDDNEMRGMGTQPHISLVYPLP